MQLCILPVNSCHSATIVMSNCTIVTSGHYGSIRTNLYQTIVQFDRTIVLPRNVQQEVYMTTFLRYCPLLGVLFEVLSIEGVTILCQVRLRPQSGVHSRQVFIQISYSMLIWYFMTQPQWKCWLS